MPQWVDQNPDQALSWFSSNVGNGPARDQAIGQFWVHAFDKDPNLGIQWVASISDPNTRAFHFRYVAKHWMQNDPASAKAWIQQTTYLTDAVKRQVLSSQN